jgi:hypothetical protein
MRALHEDTQPLSFDKDAAKAAQAYAEELNSLGGEWSTYINKAYL